MSNLTLFDEMRITMDEAIEFTKISLCEYGEKYKHWAIAFSGGKDSAATLTLTIKLIKNGDVPSPKTLTVLYADTRMEITPLQISAMAILKKVREMGYKTKVVLPELDDRFFVYMFGRGVPPPKNRFRWCTQKIKVTPMLNELKDLRQEYGEKFLMLTGVRVGESAARDGRIALSCGKDGAECGQGWFQETTPESIADTLAPMLHWRVCHVWDWLMFYAPDMGFDTGLIADVYGGDEKTEINARTGCVGCNLASQDFALDRVLRLKDWAYLEPLKGLKPLYAELIKAKHRLRKDGTERRKDGKLVKNPHRLGPLTMAARQFGLESILKIQNEVNKNVAADVNKIDLINDLELKRINQLINQNTWPRGWSGSEIVGNIMMDEVIADGVIQPLLGDIFNSGLLR